MRGTLVVNTFELPVSAELTSSRSFDLRIYVIMMINYVIIMKKDKKYYIFTYKKPSVFENECESSTLYL